MKSSVAYAVHVSVPNVVGLTGVGEEAPVVVLEHVVSPMITPVVSLGLLEIV